MSTWRFIPKKPDSIQKYIFQQVAPFLVLGLEFTERKVLDFNIQNSPHYSTQYLLDRKPDFRWRHIYNSSELWWYSVCVFITMIWRFIIKDCQMFYCFIQKRKEQGFMKTPVSWIRQKILETKKLPAGSVSSSQISHRSQISEVHLGSMRTAVLLGWDPATPPPPPHLGSYMRALWVSQDRRHLCWICKIPNHIYLFVYRIIKYKPLENYWSH